MTEAEAVESARTETHAFEAEVGRLLDIVANALYSDREVFLRELISNASDACDRLRYAALTEPALAAGDADYRITVSPDAKKRRLTIADNGIGMDRDELIRDLGTIARSGTAAFVERLGRDKADDAALIGQFGVGFYAAFMVADEVVVQSRKAGSDAVWEWRSDGRNGFTIAPGPADLGRGTRIVLHLRKDAKEFLEPERLRAIIKRYSDHIAIPIALAADGEEETVNAALALWTRPKNEIAPEQYAEFYRHASHLFDEPWLTIHNRVEGKLSYTNLLFVPSTRPFDLFHPERKGHVKLYVKRVFITDDCPELLPGYLRFLRGVVDSEDIPLNISREMLQNNPVVAKIRSGLVKRVLGALKRKAEKDAESYAAFWENFGAVLKEGLYEDQANREALLELARFHTVDGDRLIGLSEYVDGMKEGQEAIYTISAETLEAARRSPQVEAFRARGVAVLVLTDPVDEFWTPAVGSYRGKPFRSVTRGRLDLDRIAPDEEKKEAEKEGEGALDDRQIDSLIAAFKLALGDAVKDVRASSRLTESPVCLVADEGDMDIRLERLLKRHRQIDRTAPRILEINPRHGVIRALARKLKAGGGADAVGDAAKLLLDQARLMEGEPLPDPAGFAKRLSATIEKGLG